ncbi:putative ORAOV1 family protein [Neolecta irregularis DAH-3]|uniref:Putative ORAOV1 family protein n=1 Tax=Neolecta irregularis (strain DAH-3) TaxID=1198029 RepID=A0A1U7LVW5_NEOID|nr:putative ORAOV1 family protein [Neolecta irregularis DAH-3]|eukprot:OLL26807.1 putative ORAOV1 family protein [Neolecta irregularis DAH-3]
MTSKSKNSFYEMTVEHIDVLDNLVNLEETFYREGYAEGQTDGIAAGEIEGRAFGLEQSFGYFYKLGYLKAQCTALLKDPETPAKALKHTDKLKSMIEQVPQTNQDQPEGEDFDSRWRRIKAKSRLVRNLTGRRDIAITDQDGELDVVEELDQDADMLARIRGDPNLAF